MYHNNVESERYVLGAVILDVDRLWECLEFLEDDGKQFWLEKHRAIWRACCKVALALDRGASLDLTMVNTEIVSNGGESNFTYLTSLTDFVPVTYNARTHASIVADCYRARVLRHALDEATDAMSDPDPNAAVSTAIATIMPATDTSQRVELLSWGQCAEQEGQRLQEQEEEAQKPAAERRQLRTDYSTGLTALDEIVRPVDTDLIYICGRPGMGKSALTSQIAFNWACRGLRVGIINAEMPRQDEVGRHVARQARIDHDKYRAGCLTIDEYQRAYLALSQTYDIPLRLVFANGISLAAVLGRARLMKRQWDIQALIVDYLQLVENNSRRGERRLDVEGIAIALKNFAKQEHVLAVANVQLNRKQDERGGANKFPVMADIAEANIEKHADTIAFVHRPWQLKTDFEKCRAPLDEQRQTYLCVEKNRNARTGQPQVDFIGEHLLFQDRDSGYRY